MSDFSKIAGTLLYVCIQEPVKAYQAVGEDAKPMEWKVSVATGSEDLVDDYEAYAKSIDAKVSIKKVKSAEFESIYKCPPPEDAGKNVWVFTFRKSTELGKTGKPVPDIYKPKVFQRKGNTLLDQTNSILVGNGSTGIVSTEVFTRANGSSSIYLKNVLVENLVEYVKQEASYVVGSEFGATAEQPKQAAVAAAKPAVKKKPVVEEDDSLSDPF